MATRAALSKCTRARHPHRAVKTRFFALRPSHCARSARIQPHSMSSLSPEPTSIQAVKRSCPGCGSASHSEPLSREHGYELVRCRDCQMLFTHNVQTIEAKILHYDKLAKERTDTTSILSPAHYGLANQIKSVGLYERVLQYVVERIPEGNINFVDVGCAGGLFLLAAQAIDGYHCGVAPRFNVRGISIDPRERSETERNVGCPVLFPDEAAEAWAGWADAVTLMNVLEHAEGRVHAGCGASTGCSRALSRW